MMIAAYAIGFFVEPQSRIPRIPDTLYCLSWIYITLKTYTDETSGYPPLLILYPLVWELWAALLYIGPSGMPAFMQFNYWVWLALSVASFGMIYLYDRAEFTFGHPRLFWAKAAFEFVFASVLYIGYASRPGGLEGFFVVIGTALATMISIFFFLLLLRRPTLKGQSLVGNVLRIFAENGSLSYTLSLYPDSLYLKTLLVFTVLLDAVYLICFFKKVRLSFER